MLVPLYQVHLLPLKEQIESLWRFENKTNKIITAGDHTLMPLAIKHLLIMKSETALHYWGGTQQQ